MGDFTENVTDVESGDTEMSNSGGKDGIDCSDDKNVAVLPN